MYRFKKLIKPIFFKYSQLNKQTVSVNDNLTIYVYSGIFYNSLTFTVPIGKIIVEQIVDTVDKKTKTTYTLTFSTGVISFVLYHDTNNGKGFTGSKTFGPVICGTQKYLFINSGENTGLLDILDDDNRRIDIFKKTESCSYEC